MKINDLEDYQIFHHAGTRSECGCDNGREAFIIAELGSVLSEELHNSLGKVEYRHYDDENCYLVGQENNCTVISWNDPYYCEEHRE